jgi:hypothetical protein
MLTAVVLSVGLVMEIPLAQITAARAVVTPDGFTAELTKITIGFNAVIIPPSVQ